MHPEVVRQAVAETVHKQVGAGVDIVNDGEVNKSSYSTYVTSRLSGFTGEGQHSAPADLAEYPAVASQVFSTVPLDQLLKNRACEGPVRYQSMDQLKRDIDNLKEAAKNSGATQVFMTAASPGAIDLFLPNRYYPTAEEYLGALADAMKTEYDAIHQSGLLLQLDCHDLAMGAHMGVGLLSEADHRRGWPPE
jgi:5-methyltetrahydropteroyltriglutamate--homocysteine methyltransferase